MSEWVDLRIVSDGTPTGTSVYAGDKLVNNVVAVSWEIDVGGYAQAEIKVVDVAVDAVGETPVEPRPLATEDLA